MICMLGLLRKLFKAEKEVKSVESTVTTITSSDTTTIESNIRTLAFYPIINNYSYVHIYVGGGGSKNYMVIEPPLNTYEVSVLHKVKDILIRDEEVVRKLKTLTRVEEGIQVIKEFIIRGSSLRDEVLADKISYYIARDLIGYSIIDPLIKDPNLEDIVCTGVNVPIYVFHTEYEWLRTNIVLTDVVELERIIRRLAFKSGIEISIAKPIAEGILRNEGFRVHLVLDVVSRRGSTFTIRKFKTMPYTLVDLINLRTVDPLLAAYLWLLADNLRSIMIVGPTASGKTTLLNAIAMMIPPEVKVVTVEEAPELNLIGHENWVSMVARLSSEEGVTNVTLYELLKSSLRQRPDVIIVGEIRGEEAYTFFQSIALGHGGMTTIHADSIESAIRRLEAHPFNIPKSFLQLVKVFILVGRVQVGTYATQRRVLEVKEVEKLDTKTNELVMITPFRWVKESDSIEFSGYSHIIKSIADDLKIDYNDVYNDLLRRATIMKWLSLRRVNLQEMNNIVRKYRSDWFTIYSLAESEVGRWW